MKYMPNIERLSGKWVGYGGGSVWRIHGGTGAYTAVSTADSRVLVGRTLYDLSTRLNDIQHKVTGETVNGF